MSRALRSTRGAMEVLVELGAKIRKPLAAMIEVADRCNETCLHCYQVQGQKGEMTTEQIFGLLDGLAAKGVLFLTISGGEATLRSDFLEIVAYSRKLKFAVKVYSNGLRMTRELAGALSEMAVQEVQMSLYSPRAEVHDEITCVPGSFVKTTNGARYLVEAGVPVVLKTPLMKFNAGDHDRYIAMCEEIGADYLFDAAILSREDGDLTPLQYMQDEASTREVLSDARVMSQDALKSAVAPELDAPVCGACVGSIHVEANGELRPCAALTVSVGNVLEGGLDDSAVNSDAEFIKNLTWGSLHACRRCDLRAYCTRCFETARSDGDALGPYQQACSRALSRWSMAHDLDPIVVGEHHGVGPYIQSSQGFRVRTYELSDEDRKARENHPWITERAKDVAPSKDLVQIRRSGGGDPLEVTVDRSHQSGSVPRQHKSLT